MQPVVIDIDEFSSIMHASATRGSIDTIVECSHPFDAYGNHSSLERISIVAHRVWEARATWGSFAGCTLDDLRVALYVTQRGWHSHDMAVEPDVGIEWELVEAINEASGGLVSDDRPIPR